MNVIFETWTWNWLPEGVGLCVNADISGQNVEINGIDILFDEDYNDADLGGIDTLINNNIGDLEYSAWLEVK